MAAMLNELQDTLLIRILRISKDVAEYFNKEIMN